MKLRIVDKIKAAMNLGGAYFHWSNESKKDGGGALPLKGRAWLRLPDSFAVKLEWCLLDNLRASLGVRLDGPERELCLFGGVPGATVYLTIEHPQFAGKESPAWRVSISDSLNWNFGLDDWDGSSQDWPRYGYVNLIDLFLGKVKTKLIRGTEHQVRVPLPEGSYPAIVYVEERDRDRPRAFGFARRRTWIGNVRIDTEKAKKEGLRFEAPPIPGKGENSWDCGDDAIYAMGAPARNVAEAVTAYVGSVLSARLQRAGRIDWLPPTPSPEGAPTEPPPAPEAPAPEAPPPGTRVFSPADLSSFS